MTDPATSISTSADDAERAVQVMIDWLDRWGIDAIPGEPIPPYDSKALTRARLDANRAAAASGRTDRLRRLHALIVDWAMARYRLAGLHAVYYGGALEPADQRRTGIEVLLDAASAYLLADVLPDEVTTALLARFDVKLGGPIFRSEMQSEPS